MSRLLAQERHDRLRLDERTLALVNVDSAPISISAHASAADARTGHNPVGVRATAVPPTHYRVVFDFDTLAAPAKTLRPTVVHIDLTANGDYPFKEPVCRVVGDVVPWTPHFHPAYPICIGSGWSHDGRTLAVDLVTHIAKLLNFDEPRPTPGYEGWNGAAIRWWINEHDCRPLDPTLRYPVIDPNLANRRGARRIAAAARPAGRVTPTPPARRPRVTAARPRVTAVTRVAPRVRPSGAPR